MALNTSRYYPISCPPLKGQILDATGTGAVTLITGGSTNSNWTVIESLGCSMTDTTARVIQLSVTLSSVDYNICAISVPVEAGTKSDGLAGAIDMLRHLNWPWLAYDAFGNRICMLPNGAALKAASKVTVTSGKQIDFFGSATEY